MADIYQQAYQLSLLSNCAGGQRDTATNLEQYLTNKVDQFIGQVNGSWQISYGPIVYKSSEDNYQGKVQGPENACFAATSSANGNVCVLAFAGTASTSHAAIEGDQDVGVMVNFDDWVKGWSEETLLVPEPANVSGPDDDACYIAHGTAIAVCNILGADGHTSPPRDKTVYKYLISLPDDYTIIFTGHSLGGAIAPTAALGLVQAGLLGKKTVYVMPSAGASPGVQTFATRYNQIFPISQDQGDFRCFNANYFNTYDVVPQAWSTSPSEDRNMTRIKNDIYNDEGPLVLGTVGRLVKEAEANLKPEANPPYVAIQGRSFTSTKPAKDTLLTLKATVLREHVKDYWYHLGLQQFFDDVTAATKVSFSVPAFDASEVPLAIDNVSVNE